LQRSLFPFGFPASKSYEFTLPVAHTYEGWDFNSGNYLFTTDTK